MQIKICCIKSTREAMTAIRHGATALGLVGPMPSGPGPISLDMITRISADIPSDIHSFYLTSKINFEDIRDEYLQARTTHLQLTDHVSEGTRIQLKKEFPNLNIVQVVHVTDHSSIKQALSYAESSDYLLLDSGAPGKSVKELGGTGRTHNWSISRTIIQESPIPVFLAGGINADNVIEAIETVQPYGIDLCSGVRTNDILDIKKLARFFDEVHSFMS